MQTICPLGALGNCSGESVTGAGSAVDNLYRQRADMVTFSNDGDGTFSYQTSNYLRLLEADREIPHVREDMQLLIEDSFLKVINLRCI